jgi:hypothetical protein
MIAWRILITRLADNRNHVIRTRLDEWAKDVLSFHQQPKRCFSDLSSNNVKAAKEQINRVSWKIDCVSESVTTPTGNYASLEQRIIMQQKFVKIETKMHDFLKLTSHGAFGNFLICYSNNIVKERFDSSCFV